MTQRFNPEGCWPQNGRAFNHGVVEPEGRVLHMTGQVAWNNKGTIVGEDDCEVQIRTCFEGVERILDEAGGQLEDIVSLTIYFVNPADLPVIQAVRTEKFAPRCAPASVLIRVSGLVAPGLLVELVPVSVIPEHRFSDPDTRPHV